MSRGFITCQTLDTEKVVSSVNELELDSTYSLHFGDGKAIAQIKELQPSERQ
jgi:exonuclease VII large subunit